MVSLSETGSWKSSRRVPGRKGARLTITSLGGPDGCVSKRLRLALGRVLLWPSPADDGGGFRLFWRRFLVARNARSTDRKSTRLNSSHANISYAVFCLKKKHKQRSAVAKRRPLARLRSDHAAGVSV